MITDDKSSRQNRDNFAQQIQMQLSQEPKIFLRYFFAFLKSTSNFECFQKTKQCHSLSISQIPIVPLIGHRPSCKMLVLVKFAILGLFLNAITTDDKISRHNRHDFAQQIQMPRTKNFSQFLFAFLKSTSNFEFFEKKQESERLSISEIIDS